jgi:hypothetical protein
MRIRRSTIFGSLAALSLLLVAIIAIAWVKSFHSAWQLFSFSKDDEKFVLYSKGGQFLLVGPPTEPLQDPLTRQLVFQMSNADFEWSPIGSEYICGAARRDTPTWQVYQRFFSRDRRGLSLEPNMRVFIAQAKDDPNRFVPAHMLLMFAAQSKRGQLRHSNQKWLETGFRLDADGARIPEVIMRANETQTFTDFASRWDVTQEWAEVMETPRAALFHGWIWLAAMALPLAWATRPRSRKPTLLRWTFNVTALASFALFLAAMTLWVRSVLIDEQFLFSRRPATTISGFQLDSISSIGSSKGKFIFLKTQIFHSQFTLNDLWGYQHQSAPWPTPPKGVSVLGERSAHFLGIAYYHAPSQLLPSPPRNPIINLAFGVDALAIPWWTIMLLAAIAPLWWECNDIIWRRRILKEDRHLAQRCLACGYDMRATPAQCPECGEVSKESTTVPRVVR